jgi:hypothetical protein
MENEHRARRALVARHNLNIARYTLNQIVDACASAFTVEERQQLSTMIRQLETLETAVQIESRLPELATRGKT